MRQTTADFLTSITSPAERIVRKGFEGKTPYTPDEFAAAWYKSEDRAQLLGEIEDFNTAYPVGGPQLEKFKESRRGKFCFHGYGNAAYDENSCSIQKSVSLSRAYKLPVNTNAIQMHQVPIHTFNQQIALCVDRGFQRLKGDLSLMLTGFIGNACMALIIGSVFYNLQNDTASLYSRGALLFFAILMAAFQSSLEVSCPDEPFLHVSNIIPRF